MGGTQDQAALDAIIAVIDSGDVIALPVPTGLPEGTAGQVMLAARAVYRTREAVADAIGAAYGGKLSDALAAVTEAEAHMATLRKRLETAVRLQGGAP